MQGPPPPGGFGGAPPPHGLGAPPGVIVPYPGAPQSSDKKAATALLLAVVPSLFGVFGVHRFYTGHIYIGVAQLLTFGGCGIWHIIDIILITTGKFTDRDGRRLFSGAPPGQLR